MGRIFQGFLIVFVAVLSALVYSWRDMHKKTARSVALLKENVSPEEITAEQQRQLLEQMPPVVQTYLQKALPDKNRLIKTLHMTQKGTFRMENAWVPFTAIQDFSAVIGNLGFVWDATVFLPEPMPTYFRSFGIELPVYVQDWYVRGKGLLEARLLGVLPVAHFEDNPDINAGELLRWLAESFLFPTVYLQPGAVTWSPLVGDHPDRARLSVQDPQSNNPKVSLTIRFDEEGLPVTMTGMRPKTVEGGFAYSKWEGVIREWKRVDGMLVPSKMDVGWWERDKLKLYFKGENLDFEYDFV